MCWGVGIDVLFLNDINAQKTKEGTEGNEDCCLRKKGEVVPDRFGDNSLPL